MSDTMYREQILEHYKNPLNRGKLEPADAHYADSNPLCGDEIEIFLKIGKNEKGQPTISDVKFTGQGCAISTASASLLTESVKGKTLEQIKALTRDDVFALLGVPVSAARVKCALLALKAVKAAVYNYLGEKLDKKID